MRARAGNAGAIRTSKAQPGVADVTYAENPPGGEPTVLLRVDGAPPPPSAAGHEVWLARVDVDFFRVFDVPMLTGRPFQPADIGEASTPVIVNHAFVRKVLGGGTALGRRVRHLATARDAPPAGVDTARWYEIVGVVGDMHASPIDATLAPASLYHAAGPGLSHNVMLAVRTRAGAPAELAGRLRDMTNGLDPTLWLGAVRPLSDVYRQEKLVVRLVALIVGLVAGSVLLLSAAGIYALMSFTVAQRRKEIGIRAALGAHPGHVLRSIFSRAAGQLAVGMLVGVGAAVLLERASGGGHMGGLGMLILPAVAALMLAVGLLAAIGPALRGLRIQPTEALRAE